MSFSIFCVFHVFVTFSKIRFGGTFDQMHSFSKQDDSTQHHHHHDFSAVFLFNEKNNEKKDISVIFYI